MFRFNPYQCSDEKLESYRRSGKKEKQLRKIFGDSYDNLADHSRCKRQIDPAKPKVFVIPGFLGSKLYRRRRFLWDKNIWPNKLGIIAGQIKELTYNPQNVSIYAKGALSEYTALRLGLRNLGYDASFLGYDWRKSHLDEGVKTFEAIKASGHRNVVLVCHSMGGFLARRIAELDPEHEYISRIITIATPHHGTMAPFNTLRGVSPLFQLMAAFDPFHTFLEIGEQIARHVPAYSEMLPIPGMLPNNLYDYDEWPEGVKIERNLLKTGLVNKGKFKDPDERFRVVVGIGAKTKYAFESIDNDIVYRLTPDGDGQFPRSQGEIGAEEHLYYIDGEHFEMLNGERLSPSASDDHIDLLNGINELIQDGYTDKLYKRPEEYPNFESPDYEDMAKITEKELLDYKWTRVDLCLDF